MLDCDNKNTATPPPTSSMRDHRPLTSLALFAYTPSKPSPAVQCTTLFVSVWMKINRTEAASFDSICASVWIDNFARILGGEHAASLLCSPSSSSQQCSTLSLLLDFWGDTNSMSEYLHQYFTISFDRKKKKSHPPLACACGLLWQHSHQCG